MMDHSDGDASTPPSNLQSQRMPLRFVIKKRDDLSNLDAFEKEDDSVKEVVLVKGCESSCTEKLMSETSSQNEVDAANALLKMVNDVSRFPNFAKGKLLDDGSGKSALVDDVGGEFDDNEITLESSELEVEENDDDVDQFDHADNYLDSCYLQSFLDHRNFKVSWKGSRKDSLVAEGVDHSPDGLAAIGEEKVEQELESGSLLLHSAPAKVYHRRKTRNASLSFESRGKEDYLIVSSEEEKDEKGDQNEALVDGERVATRFRKKQQNSSLLSKSVVRFNSAPIKQEGNTCGGSMGNIVLASQGKRKSCLITPTVDREFSFSIIHLLSAVRMALITVQDIGKGKKRRRQRNSSQNLPSLSVNEIVDHVRSNPGDPRILQMLEPLEDLIRGVLKMFSSKAAPKGAKGWRALTHFEESCKCWSWAGPAPNTPLEFDGKVGIDTSPEGWGLPQKMLMNLVDSYAVWLRSNGNKLRQLGSLPPPPPTLALYTINAAERFRDLSAKRCIPTIKPSSDEVRAFFHREETVRYLIPERAFAYTALDGRKSTVAPVSRARLKLPSRARDHFLLKTDRPGIVSLLCVVRDAAARLPGGVGTRSDVCILLRDSQYIMDDISDMQINNIVSGALDRLHYEVDPCVHYDREKKLWVYLHGDREEEEFGDDCRCTTIKRTRHPQ
ncbi:hypothetical protein Ancab_031955 [Ancistrocladus abbreviatus]